MERRRNKYRFDKWFGRGPKEKHGRSWLRHQAAIWRDPRRANNSFYPYCPACGACGYTECCGVACHGGVGCVHLYTPLEIKHRKLLDGTEEDRDRFYQIVDPE